MLGSRCLAREASSPVGVAACALIAAVSAAFAQPADTSLPKLADNTAVLHHGLRGVELW